MHGPGMFWLACQVLTEHHDGFELLKYDSVTAWFTGVNHDSADALQQ